MTHKDDDASLHAFFSASACEITPNAAASTVRILYLPYSNARDVQQRCASVLTEDELTRMKRLVSEELGYRFAQRRAFRRFCAACALHDDHSLADIRFDTTEKGRPFLPDRPGQWFSFSSCRSGMLGAWSETHAIGVDIEPLGRRIDAIDLAKRFFAKTEAQFVSDVPEQRQSEAFIQLWCLKEAALKSIGEGLPFGLDVFQFELHPRLSMTHVPVGYGSKERWAPYLIEIEDCQVALFTRELSK